jgi:fucose permease
MKRGSKILLVSIAYVSFIGLGLSGGMLGVAWPSIRGSFGLSLDAVGALLIAEMVGYLLASFFSGPVVTRIGAGKLLLASAALRVLGLLGYGLAPSWWMVVALGVFTGLGGGAVDAGLNTYFATNHGTTLMNWLHASFGVGAMLGPILVRVVANLGASWRWGYASVGLLHALIALGYGLTLRRWVLAKPHLAEPDVAEEQVRAIDTLRLPMLWASIAMFFMFTGVETATGQWTFSLLTEARSVDADIAGFWTSVYWGGLTVGRILFGPVAEQVGIDRLSRLAMLGLMCGAGLIWWNAAGLSSFLGLVLMGLSMACLFPLAISATPKRVGAAHAANAIGFQIAAAGLGFAFLPALAGVLAQNVSLEVIAPFLLVSSVVMFLLHEVVARCGLHDASASSRTFGDGA